MFTLKLYRRVNPEMVVTKIVPCHHVETLSFQHGEDKAISLRAFDGPEPSSYLEFNIGDAEKHRTPEDKKISPDTPDWWFGWGLLENEAGRTTEHFRPAFWG